MSGVLKGIKKVFKKVINVVKKVALPVLAIGAVVLTGGAALGILPGLSATVGSLGLSPALTGILTTAGRGAVMGAVTSGLTGGNIVKGATGGLIAGGALGAVSNAIAPVAKTVTGAATAAAGGNPVLDPAMRSEGWTIGEGGAAAATAAPIASAAPGAGILSGVGSFLSKNPIMAGSLIQGIGSGLAAKAQAKEARRQDAMERDNYSVYNGLNSYPSMGAAAAPQPSGTAPFIEYDPTTGRLVARKV